MSPVVRWRPFARRAVDAELGTRTFPTASSTPALLREFDAQLRAHGIEWPLTEEPSKTRPMRELRGSKSLSPMEWFSLLWNFERLYADVPRKEMERDRRRLWAQADSHDLLRNLLVFAAINQSFGVKSEHALVADEVLTDRALSRQWTQHATEGALLAEMGQKRGHQKMLELARQEDMTPAEYGWTLFRVRLSVEVTDKVLEEIGAVPMAGVKQKDQRWARWVARCLDEGSTSAKAGLISHFLEKLPRRERRGTGLKPLMDWIWLHAKPNSSGSLWERLTPKAREEIHLWMAEVSYSDFEAIVMGMLGIGWAPEGGVVVRGTPLISDFKEQNQLRMRISFWKNFADNFERARILIPSKTKALLGKSFFEDLNFADVQAMDGGHGLPAVETMLLCARDTIIVEFLRDQMPTLLLTRTEALEQALFDDTGAYSVKRICDLAPEPPAEFDHAYMWQPVVGVALQREFGLTVQGPSRGLVYVNVFDESPHTRMFNDNLSLAKQAERERSRKTWLNRWRQRCQW